MDAEFSRLNDAQFKQANEALQNLGRHYIYFIAEIAVERTPGFGNQSPEETRYIPTGRLRGGWNHTRTPIGMSSKGLIATRGQDGPFSDYGRETLDRITEQLHADQMGGVSYLENNVGYGYLIVMGMGHHKIHRNFPEDAATSTAQEQALRRAMQAVRG